jgi:hypothetical protein
MFLEILFGIFGFSIIGTLTEIGRVESSKLAFQCNAVV